MGLSDGSVVKNPPANAGDTGDRGSVPGPGKSPGEVNATHSSIFAWKIPWTEKPGRLKPKGSQSQTQLGMHMIFYIALISFWVFA